MPSSSRSPHRRVSAALPPVEQRPRREGEQQDESFHDGCVPGLRTPPVVAQRDSRMPRAAPRGRCLPSNPRLRIFSDTTAVRGFRSTGGRRAGTPADASSRPARSRRTTRAAGASTAPRLCTVTEIERSLTTTSRGAIPRSGRDQYGVPFETRRASITVTVRGANDTGSSSPRSSATVRVIDPTAARRQRSRACRR